MKNIEIDDDLYLHIVANTQFIGENASSILRRLLKLNETTQQAVLLEESADKDDLEEPLSEILLIMKQM